MKKYCKNCKYVGNFGLTCFFYEATKEKQETPYGSETTCKYSEEIKNRIKQFINNPLDMIPQTYIDGLGCSFECYSTIKLNFDGFCPFYKRRWWKFWVKEK